MHRLSTAVAVLSWLAACGGSQQSTAGSSPSGGSPSGGSPTSGSPPPAACQTVNAADRACTRDGRPGVKVCANGTVICATTVVSLTFDDALSQQPAAAAALEKHGMRGTFFLNTWRLQTVIADNMTVAQAKDLQDRGHELGGHTLDHPHLPTLTRDQQYVEICNDRAFLMSLGLDVQNFAYPFGDWDDTTRQAVIDCHYNSARSIGGLNATVAAETLTPKDPFALRAPRSVASTDKVEDIEGWVSGAEAQGGWVLLTFHHICDGCAPNGIRPDDFESLLGWIEQRSAQGTGTARVRDMIGGTTQPAVTWPPAKH